MEIAIIQISGVGQWFLIIIASILLIAMLYTMSSVYTIRVRQENADDARFMDDIMFMVNHMNSIYKEISFEEFMITYADGSHKSFTSIMNMSRQIEEDLDHLVNNL